MGRAASGAGGRGKRCRGAVPAAHGVGQGKSFLVEVDITGQSRFSAGGCVNQVQAGVTG